MSLDAASAAAKVANNVFELKETSRAYFQKWRDFPISRIAHHGASCCEFAREWLHAMDHSQLNGESVLNGPRWIVAKYSWGPTVWPIYWCQALKQKSLDCGAQSFIANEIFSQRGVKSFQAQLVQKFSKEATDQWAERWNANDASVYWLDEDVIYHEVCAVVTGEKEIKLWDGSAGIWVNPRQFDGYGTVKAIRLSCPSDHTSPYKWGEHTISASGWHLVEGIKQK